MMRRDYLTPTCGECGRTFDLLNADDAAEWAYGHDCEAPADRCPCAFCTCGNPAAREGNRDSVAKGAA